MLPSTLRQRDTFLFERLRMHHSTPMLFLTIHLQLPNSCLKWSTKEFQIYFVIGKNSDYESALKDSGHFSSMSYNSNTQNAQRNRNRKVIWLNLPYSQNMKTNIGKLSLRLVRKHFPKNSKCHENFNLNTLKLSYCCTTNVGNIIKQHNSKVLSKTNDSNNRKCNCRSKSDTVSAWMRLS